MWMRYLTILSLVMIFWAGCSSEDGEDGMDGADGSPGQDGEDGTNGTDGEDGTNGTDGEDGTNGTDGEDGQDGQDAAEVLIESEFVYDTDLVCEQGYQLTSIGIDDGAGGGTAGDGILQAGEVQSEMKVCFELDIDKDGYLNLDDVCPENYDPLQIDNDFDRVGDACDGNTHAPYWAITRSSGDDTDPSDLYSYDPINNTATLIGSTGHSFINIKVNPADGLLYGMTRGGSDLGGCNNCLMTLNTTTAAATEVAQLPSGPHPSIAFLSDGSLYSWNEDNDMFDSIDIDSDTYTELGTSISSWGHGMCATGDDEILWVNGGGEVFLIDPSNGDRTSLGLIEDSADDISWVPLAGYDEYGVRGDCNPDTLFYIGVDLTYGEVDSTIVTVRLYDNDEPVALSFAPAPVANFHYIAMPLNP